jgi:hypothetical protein
MSFEITEHRSGSSPVEHFDFLSRATKFADEVGPLMRDALQREAPVGDPLDDPHPGRLRDSIRYSRTTSPTEGTVVSWTVHVPYADYVVKGTGEHLIYPVAALALHFHDRDGREVFVRSVVDHPGARANNFPERAERAVRDRMNSAFARIMTENR